MKLQAVLEGFQETDVVMAGIQARQAEVPKGHGEWLEQLQKQELAHQRWLEKHQQTMAEFDDKRNALISVVDDLVRHRRSDGGQ
jgi:hypothetical protein